MSGRYRETSERTRDDIQVCGPKGHQNEEIGVKDEVGAFWFADDKEHWEQISGINLLGERLTHIVPTEHGHELSSDCPCDPDFDEESTTYLHKRAH